MYILVNSQTHFYQLQICYPNQEATKLFEVVQRLSGAPTNTVATSVYMRRHGFFIAAQLHLMCEHNLLWAGDLEDVSLFMEDDPILFSVHLPALGLYKTVKKISALFLRPTDTLLLTI